MLKNNKAVTLLVLVVTVIVILILGGTTFVASDALIKKTKKKTILANMYLVKGEVESIYEEYQFNGEITTLKGARLVDSVDEDEKFSAITVIKVEDINTLLSIYGAKKEDGDLWYSWNRATLSELGFDSEIIPEHPEEGKEYYYIVNYATGEIIYTPGFKDTAGNIIYTLTKMSAKSSDEINDEGI